MLAIDVKRASNVFLFCIFLFNETRCIQLLAPFLPHCAWADPAFIHPSKKFGGIESFACHYRSTTEPFAVLGYRTMDQASNFWTSFLRSLTLISCPRTSNAFWCMLSNDIGNGWFLKYLRCGVLLPKKMSSICIFRSTRQQLSSFIKFLGKYAFKIMLNIVFISWTRPWIKVWKRFHHA